MHMGAKPKQTESSVDQNKNNIRN